MEQNEIKKDKRYLVFCYDIRYPYGGFDDFRGSFDLAQEARDYAYTLEFNCTEIYDRVEGVMIYEKNVFFDENTDIRLSSEV